MAILSNIQGREIHLVLKSRARFHDELGFPDHCSKPPAIKIGGHFRAKFAKESLCSKHKNFGALNRMCLKNGIDIEIQTEQIFFYSGRQIVDLGW